VKVPLHVRGDAEAHPDNRKHGDRHVHQQKDLPRRNSEHETTHHWADSERNQAHGGAGSDTTLRRLARPRQPAFGLP